MNLLRETISDLNTHGKSPSDVVWVGCEGASGTWDEFAACANFDYYEGFGTTEIIGSLKVVGNDWWLERDSYDGQEYWSFKTLPVRPATSDPLARELILQAD